VLTDVLHRVRAHLRRQRHALRRAAVPIAQMAIAVGVSWYVASEVFGHTNTYFAPIAAAVVLRVAPGQRTKRAVEMVAGITVGIAVGDLVVREIGVGGWQIALIVTMAVSVAILLGAGNLIASQAAATAVLVASLPSPDASYTRFTDALIGGCVGLTVLIAVPRSPLTPLRRLVDPFLAQCADALAQSADALARRDADAASRALHDAYDIGRLGHSYSRELQQSQETALLSPVRRHELSEVDRYIDATPHIDGLARDTRVLCRAVRGAIETDASVPNELPDAIRELAAAVAELPELLSKTGGDEGESVSRALGAAASARQALSEPGELAVIQIVGQVRSAAVDVLRALGADRAEADAHVRAVGG